jgi:hypothetical protein
MAGFAAPDIQDDRRQDAGYMRRLLEETHEAAFATRKCLFEGNGEPALVVQMANLKSDQARQRIDIDAIRKDLNDQMRALIIVQQTLLVLTNAFSKVGVTLICAIVLAILGFVWALISHAITLGP